MSDPIVINTIIQDFIKERDIRKFFVEHSLKYKSGTYDSNRTLYVFIEPIKDLIVDLCSRLTSNPQVIQFISDRFEYQFYVGVTSHGYEFYFANVGLNLTIDSIEVSNGVVSEKSYSKKFGDSSILLLYPSITNFLVKDEYLVRNDGQQYFRFLNGIKPHIAVMIGIFKYENRKQYSRWTVEQYKAERKVSWIQLSNDSITVYYRTPIPIQLKNNEERVTFM